MALPKSWRWGGGVKGGRFEERIQTYSTCYRLYCRSTAPWLPWKFNFKQLAYLDCEIALPCLNSLKIKAFGLTQQLSFSGLEPNDNLNILSTLRGTLLVGGVFPKSTNSSVYESVVIKSAAVLLLHTHTKKKKRVRRTEHGESRRLESECESKTSVCVLRACLRLNFDT